MAAKAFEVIGAVFVVLFLFLLLIILPLINKLLKNVNRSFSTATRDVRKQVNNSISEIETAQEELFSLEQVTDQFKSTLDSILQGADLVIDFLNSSMFKMGFTCSIWFLFAAVAFPRGLHRSREIKPKKKVTPSPSLEKA